MRELCALLAGDACDEARLPELLTLARIHRVHLLLAQLNRLRQGYGESRRSEAKAEPRPTDPAWESLLEETRVEAIRDTLRVRELLRVVTAL
jgi:hypothetical protein